MKGTLFFVHGTGVRENGYQSTVGAVQDGARRHLPGIEVVGVPWGPKLGVSVDRLAQALPPEATTRGPAVTADADITAATWALLTEDPLFELRLAAQQGPPPVAAEPVAADADQALIALLRRVLDNPPPYSDTGVGADELAAVIAALAVAPELAGAARAVGRADDPELVQATARAVVASVLARHRQDAPGTAPLVVMSGAVRDRMVAQVAAAMAPAPRGRLTDWLKRKTIAFAEQRATALATERRQALMGTSTPGIGDILLYQRRGEAIRQMVADQLAATHPPVVAVGHSLGGIILIDLLTGGVSGVQLLVTAGSQSPLFYLIDALGSLRPGQPEPAPFTPWLNIYNRQDLLSFYAGRAFPDVPGISDEPVDPGVPFPAAHSAYWHEDRVFELIGARWPTG